MLMDKLHAALGAALDEPQAEPTAEPAPEVAETSQESAPEPTAEAGGVESAPEPEAQAAPGERARGPDGKFTTAPPKTTAPTTPKNPPQPVAKAPATTQDSGPAPRTMAPAAREHWAALPRPVKDAFLKVEGQAARAVNEAQQHRQVAERFTQAVQPFLPHLHAMGVAPEVAIQHLFRMEHTLRAGSVAERVDMIANLMAHSGVTPDVLATRLEGKPLPQGGQPPRDPRFDELLGHMRQAGQRRVESANERAAAQLRAFEATNPEFLHDVMDEMADLVTAERRKGHTVDAAALQRIYENACYLNPDVRQIMEQRKAEESKRAKLQKVQQAQHAGGSIQSQPAPPGMRRTGMAGLYEALQKNLAG